MKNNKNRIKRTVKVILIIAAAGCVLYLSATFYGLHLVNKGQAPFDEATLTAEGGDFIINEDGRHVEYFIYGNLDKDSMVVINIHGSGPEAKSEMLFFDPVCKALGVKGISISLPGYGYTDMKPGRQVSDWPKEDLEPILKEEGVGSFMITGHSQGNPHAMAAAYYFGDRCVGLGMNAPLLPASVSRDEGVKGSIGMDSLLSTDDLKKLSNAWYFTVYNLGLVTFSPWLPLQGAVSGFPNLKDDEELTQKISDTVVRAVVRGSVGGAWESAGDVAFDVFSNKDGDLIEFDGTNGIVRILEEVG